ncbi:MAG: hypothetical protein U0163_09220 [Gemmatimonadaceae bacterium]
MLIIVLRLLHVVAAVLWTGGAVVVAAFLVPSVLAAGPAGGVVMREIVGVRKLPVQLTILGWITVLAGFALYGIDMRGSAWGGTMAGMIFGVGGVCGLIALLIGTFWSRPVAARLMALGSQMASAGSPPPAPLVAEVQGLQSSLAKATKAVALFAVLAAIAMSVARYV